MSGSRAPGTRAPAPATEVITDETGTSRRRVRKLAVRITRAPSEADRGKTFTLAQDEIRIGSDPACDVPLDDPAVSREHLAIRLSQNGFELADVGSTNGTFLGEVRIERITITQPCDVALGKSVVSLAPLGETVEQEISPRTRFGRMLGASPAMRETFALLEKVAPSDLTVLVEGETGTGKELAAEGIHEASGRAGPFVAVNCGAIPRELLESELFGHEKGAFTGAIRDRVGAFASAQGGTLFLDEVGELPLDMQAKILRALERREVKPVGSDRSIAVDARIVAATNRSLGREVAEGRFRQDLYFRLAVVTIKIPPLRTRPEDVKLLVDAVQDELERRRTAAGAAPPTRLDAAALAMLARYDFPGNVRELRNIVERWSVLGAGGLSSLTRAPEVSASGGANAEDGVAASLLALPYHEAKELHLERFERAFVEEALRRSDGNVSKAARDAGVDRRHLQRLMVRFGVKASD